MRHPINDQTTVVSYPSTPRVEKLEIVDVPEKFEIVDGPKKLDDDVIEKFANLATERIMEKIKERRLLTRLWRKLRKQIS